ILAGKFLKDFLIDINKNVLQPGQSSVGASKLILSKDEKIIQNLDKKIYEIDKKLSILPRLKPLNLEEEKKMFFQNKEYSPKFIYKKISTDLNLVKKEIGRLPTQADHPLMPIYLAKIGELKNKAALLQTRG